MTRSATPRPLPALLLTLLVLLAAPRLRAQAPDPLDSRLAAAIAETAGPGGARYAGLAGAAAAALAEDQRFAATDRTADARFGIDVALDGTRALVGASGDDGFRGAAYVFDLVAGVWTQTAKLIGTERAGFRQFGVSVALEGDRALIGDFNNNEFRGSVDVFTFDGAAWTRTARLTANDGVAGNGFGTDVALDGDRALVGAGDDANGPELGAAYVFDFAGGAWTQTAKLAATDGAVGDRFGLSVALDGDRALVGAGEDDIGANADQGSAYVFDLAGVWAQTAKLAATDGAAGDRFGGNVALDGDRALVGAISDDANRGAAYVFERSGMTWAQTAKLTAADGVAGDIFGRSVALSGLRALVGASFDDTNRGAGYVFEVSGGVWTQTAKLTASDGGAQDRFGFSVLLDGPRAFVGAVGDDAFRGSVYTFTLAPLAACSDAATGPSFNGQTIADGARQLVEFSAPTGAVTTEFSNTTNLVVGAPETLDGAAVPHTRAGDTFTFTGAPTVVRFPVSPADASNQQVSFSVLLTDGCGRGAAYNPSLTLPVELAAFTARSDGGTVRLAWVTASETANAGFGVEVRPADAADWRTAGFVPGHGTTAERRTYAYAVEGLAPGRYSFRLRQVDFDGTARYSALAEAAVEAPRVLALGAPRPNPARGRATLAFTVPTRGRATVIAYDALGREVARLFDDEAEGGVAYAATLDGASLAPGTYFVRVAHGGRVQTQRVALVR